MPAGPGKYDDVCTLAREAADADAAIVIIIGGKYGEGFSMQAIREINGPEVAETLEIVAKQIRDSWEAAIIQAEEQAKSS